MTVRIIVITMAILVLAQGGALAQMGGMGAGMGGMGGGNNGYPGPSTGPGTGSGSGHMGGAMAYGKGYGMSGIGSMRSSMFGNTTSYGYLQVLNPVNSPAEAQTVVEAFIKAANSTLQISELWEYEAVYKAELSDTKGAMAFDLMIDKLTGAVSPEMGMSMMLNASYGSTMYKTSSFGKKLALTAQQAWDIAQNFLDNNKTTLETYVLKTQEIYPGYYKFHTSVGTDFGMDIMVNGYNGGVWMNTVLGVPIEKY
jgi:hypothetical protein